MLAAQAEHRDGGRFSADMDINKRRVATSVDSQLEPRRDLRSLHIVPSGHHDVYDLHSPRNVHHNGLYVAEGRSASGELILSHTATARGAAVATSISAASPRALAIAHTRRLADDGYVLAERRAARCATLVARQGDDDDDECAGESMLAVLLRRRANFVAVPVEASPDTGEFVCVAEGAPRSGARRRGVMMTMVPEDMHCRLAVQSRADAVAYLEMLRDEEGFTAQPSRDGSARTLRDADGRPIARSDNHASDDGAGDRC